MKFSFSMLLSGLFLAYMANNMYSMYKLFTPPLCSDTDPVDNCYSPKMVKNSEGFFEFVQLRVYISTAMDNLGYLATTVENLQMTDVFRKDIEVTIPNSVATNGFLYAHAIVLPYEFEGKNPMTSTWRVHAASEMIVFQEPASEEYNLLGEKQVNKKKDKNRVIQLAAHFRSVLPIRIVSETERFKIDSISGELRNFLTLEDGKKYLPMMFIDEMSMRSKHLTEISEASSNGLKMNLTIDYEPTSVAKLLLLTSTARSLDLFMQNGFKDKDMDEIRGLFTETSIVLLMTTFVVSAFHLVFDALAFKNDISFWRERKSMVGLSTKTLIWRCFSQTIIFIYLYDQETSLLVLIPAGISTLIEYWKVTIAYKMSFSFKNGIKFGAHSKEENETDSIDSQGMIYLTILMVPIIIGGSVYSLYYQDHKSWRSWLIKTSANGVYGFGFLFMLPQLFLNYKLKSVAHLPWRTFMYKAFNTFIDDLFAFIITMPTAHRMACFRDDIVFLVYLYQRYLYPVDYSRVNEFGGSGKDEEEKKAKKED